MLTKTRRRVRTLNKSLDTSETVFSLQNALKPGDSAADTSPMAADFAAAGTQTRSLSALLVCGEPQTLRMLYEPLQQRGIGRQVCASAQVALEVLAISRFDLLFVDLDMAGPDWLGNFARVNACAHETAVIAIATEGETLVDLDANIVRFALQKPLSDFETGRTVEAACNSILLDKRPAFRYSVNMSVLAMLLNKGKERRLPNTTLENISLTGACINSSFTLPLGERLSLHFYLPENHAPFLAIGKVIWSDSLGHCGLQFQQVSSQHFSALRSWLAIKAAEQAKISSTTAVPLGHSISEV